MTNSPRSQALVGVVLSVVSAGCVKGPAPRGEGPPPGAARVGYVLGPDEGETLVRRTSTVVVKVDPRRGSPGLAVGTQALPAGSGIPLHRHLHADEVLRVEQGHAHALLNGQVVDVEPGSTMFVPQGTWHGVKSVGEPVQVLWIVTPPGLEDFFRADSSPPGTPPPQFTPEQVREIGLQHGTEFAPPP